MPAQTAKPKRAKKVAPVAAPHLKYEFTGETKDWLGTTLHRIRALVAIASLGVRAGDLGGWIEKEFNLSQVYGNAWVSGDARVYGNARVYGVNIVATRSDGYTFLVAPTPNGPRIIAGCRYFTFKQAKDHWKANRGGTKLGDESLSIVSHLEKMAKINGFMEPVK